MTLKYRRSIIFDQPEQTTAKLALQTVVSDYKQRLRMNLRTNSESGECSAERLTAGQARYIEGLQAKLKTISFHTLYKQYHKNTLEDEPPLLDPQKMKMFRSGKFYRCTQRPRAEELKGREESRRREMKEYFERQPEEEMESGTDTKRKRTTIARLGKARTIQSSKKF